METLFSKIIRREIPAKIIYENDRICAFEDIQPQAPIHILIVPKEPIPTINDLNPVHATLIGELFLTARDLAHQYQVSESGYRVVMNCNQDAGQTIFHLHLHFLAGRAFQWPPG